MPKMKVNEIQYNDTIGQKEATMTVTNDAILFLQDAVNVYLQERSLTCPTCGTVTNYTLGDKDDATLQAIKLEVKEDLHQAWKALNPS